MDSHDYAIQRPDPLRCACSLLCCRNDTSASRPSGDQFVEIASSLHDHKYRDQARRAVPNQSAASCTFHLSYRNEALPSDGQTTFIFRAIRLPIRAGASNRNHQTHTSVIPIMRPSWPVDWSCRGFWSRRHSLNISSCPPHLGAFVGTFAPTPTNVGEMESMKTSSTGSWLPSG
ncbi:hypothetical protein Tsp_09922 [Trichinella spiralis]|uniref:hypothetical protein n=1 Tax=Trichinella spiralis TaxID=6334 RepID=UPI0001EFDFFC|nr:hypothetical protein Tsp_09922 [Trichinella spiralis]